MKNKMHLLLALLVLRIRSMSINNTRHIILSYFYLTKQSQIQKQRVENLNAPSDSVAWRSTFKPQYLEVMVSSLSHRTFGHFSLQRCFISLMFARVVL